MLDPTCPDITGRVLESLAAAACGPRRRAPRRELPAGGARERRKLVRPLGCENYIYGSFLAMRGLAASGAPEAKEAIAKAAQWLRTIQSPMADGRILRQLRPRGLRSRAELPVPDRLGRAGPAGRGDRESAATRRGIQFSSGSPAARWYLARGSHHRHRLPNVFYLTYGMYRDYFRVGAGAGVERTRPPAPSSRSRIRGLP